MSGYTAAVDDDRFWRCGIYPGNNDEPNYEKSRRVTKNVVQERGTQDDTIISLVQMGIENDSVSNGLCVLLWHSELAHEF